MSQKSKLTQSSSDPVIFTDESHATQYCMAFDLSDLDVGAHGGYIPGTKLNQCYVEMMKRFGHDVFTSDDDVHGFNSSFYLPGFCDKNTTNHYTHGAFCVHSTMWLYHDNNKWVIGSHPNIPTRYVSEMRLTQQIVDGVIHMTNKPFSGYVGYTPLSMDEWLGACVGNIPNDPLDDVIFQNEIDARQYCVEFVIDNSVVTDKTPTTRSEYERLVMYTSKRFGKLICDDQKSFPKFGGVCGLPKVIEIAEDMPHTFNYTPQSVYMTYKPYYWDGHAPGWYLTYDIPHPRHDYNFKLDKSSPTGCSLPIMTPNQWIVACNRKFRPAGSVSTKRVKLVSKLMEVDCG